MLAHSLRDAGTIKKLAILVTLDTVSVEVVTQLEASLSIPVDKDPGLVETVTNLWLLVCLRLCATCAPYTQRAAGKP